MKINHINNINFKKNYFEVQKRGNNYLLSQIGTDNEENLGKEPILQITSGNYKFESPMEYKGKNYMGAVSPSTSSYRIYYKDTGKYENNGEYKQINPLYFTKIAVKEDFKYNDLPLEQPIAKGEAEGKVFVNTLDLPTDIPIVLVLDEIKDENTIVNDLPKNVKSVMVAQSHMDVLSHAANLIRNRIPAMSIIWDENKFNDLKNNEGKYLSVNNENGILKYKETEPSSLKSELKTSSKINIPKLEKVEKLLTFDELTPNNCGNKGYRLGLMQKLADNGILKDITIPKGFVIPEGYINKLNEYIDVEDEQEKEDLLYDGIYTDDVEQKVKDLGMDRRNLIARSNFNTEDLSSFSSAGIYESKLVYDDWILPTALDVIETKDSYKAKFVHEKYGVKNTDIQPSVIIQDKIKTNYCFTVYSNDGDNNVLMELNDYRLGYSKPTNALIRYNKKTKELKLERKLNPLAEYLIDEQGHIVEQNHIPSRFDKDWESIKESLSTVIDGALTLENYFNAPQDIEGGIGKDGKIYFWQTRDIVAKEVNKI